MLDPSTSRALATHDWDATARETPLEEVQGLGKANALWSQVGACHASEDLLREQVLQRMAGQASAQ